MMVAEILKTVDSSDPVKTFNNGVGLTFFVCMLFLTSAGKILMNSISIPVHGFPSTIVIPSYVCH